MERLHAARAHEPAYHSVRQLIFRLQPGLPASHVACLLATNENVSDMAVVRGPFSHGLTRAEVDFLVTACSLLAGLVSSVVDADRVGRQQKQF